MDKLNRIKSQINKLGVSRLKPEGFNLNTAGKYYLEIADSLLKKKKEKFDMNSVKSIIEYMLRWSYCYGENIDFTKGFLIKGKTGRGKTFLFRAWYYFLQIDNVKFEFNGEDYKIQPVIVNVKQISGEYQNPVDGGYRIIEKYSKIKSLVIDDIGKEDEYSKNYSNSVNVVEEIINNREENNMLTFGTTNLDKLSEKYDDRTVSRMNKQFKGLSLNHEIDYRIKPNKDK